MVKAVCRFNEEKVKKMSKRMRVSSILTSLVMSLIILAMGAVNIISSFKQQEVQKWVFLILGIVISLFAFYPIITAISTNKKNYRDTLEAMSLDKGELILEFVIKEKKIELKAIQNGEEQNDTILIRNLSLIKTQKEGVGIYLNENMYFICNDEIVVGNMETLLRIFKNAGIKIKKR